MSSHNNIPATIGNTYHYLVVVDKLFDLEKNQKIIIEVHGDITKATVDNELFLENYEVKFHQDKNELSYSNEDFWKSIKNWVKEVDKYAKSTELILYTTSTLQSGLINFNLKNIDEKLELLYAWKAKTANKNILSHFKIVFGDEEKLKKVLKKLKFTSSQINYLDKKQEIITKHKDYFDSFEDNENAKLSAIDYFMGKILSALKNKNNWEIDFITFRSIRNEFLEKNKPSKKIIEEHDVLNIVEDSVQQDITEERLYVQKLKKLDFEEEELLVASRNKYRAINFSNQLLNHSRGVYKDKFKKCEEIFTNEWKGKKVKYKRKSKNDDILKSSQDLYDEAMSIDVLCLYDEDKTQSFRKGYWHILADDDEKLIPIYWLIEDNKS